MRTSVCLGLLIGSLVVTAAAVAAGGTARPVPWPLAPSAALAGSAGPAADGDGPSTPAGDHLACIRGRRYAISQPIENHSSAPVTLTGAVLDPLSVQVVRRVAVQFQLAPRPPKGDGLVLGLHPWSAAVATPVTIPPHRSAWVQSNFLMTGCNLLLPDRTLVANKAITLVYRSNGHTGRERIPVAGLRLNLTP